jgi:hypothetical protein
MYEGSGLCWRDVAFGRAASRIWFRRMRVSCPSKNNLDYIPFVWKESRLARSPCRPCGCVSPFRFWTVWQMLTFGGTGLHLNLLRKFCFYLHRFVLKSILHDVHIFVRFLKSGSSAKNGKTYDLRLLFETYI